MKMDKQFFDECIIDELFNGKKRGGIKAFFIKHFVPTKNSVYLIRKMQLCNSRKRTKFNILLSKYYCYKLAYKYCINIGENVQIGKGLRIGHPSSITIVNGAVIGNNFTILQNTTIGIKNLSEEKSGKVPKIGNNCVMYANSLVLGDITLCDNTVVGCNSTLLCSTDNPGVYAGNPAKRVASS